MKFNKFFNLLIFLIITCNYFSTANRMIKKIQKSRYRLKNGTAGALTLVKKQTNKDDFGNGSIYFLDRHDLNCDIGVLTEFTLNRQGEYKYQFDYSCVQPTHCDENCLKELQKNDSNKCKHLSTNPNDIDADDKTSLNYLDRHDLVCPEGTLMTQFNLKSKRNPNKIYYNYTCCPMKLGECKEDNLEQKTYGNLSTIFLDKYRVGNANPNAYGIQRFRLLPDYSKKTFYYSIKTCFIIG